MRRAIFVVLLCGVAAAPAAAQQAGVDEPPSRRVAEQRPALLSCGIGPAFPPNALGNTRGYQRRKGPLGRALGRFVRDEIWKVDQPATGWFLAAHDEDEALVLSGTLRRGYGSMRFERRKGRWRWGGSGDCRPRTSDSGLDAVTWRPRPGTPLPPGTTRVPVLVQEQNCASGDDARGRIVSPLVHYGTTAVTVTYFVRPLDGVHTCQGVPETPATLVLDEPLNGRRLLDGGPYPARTPGSPE